MDGSATLIGLIGRASLQGALAILAVWAVCRLFPRLPASLRCGLWWLACLKLVLGLVWTTPVPLPLLPPAERPAVTLVATAPMAEAGMAAALPTTPPLDEAAAFPWTLVLAGLWAAGLVGHLAWTTGQLRRVRAIVREAEPVKERWVVDLFTGLRERLPHHPARRGARGGGRNAAGARPVPAAGPASPAHALAPLSGGAVDDPLS